MRSSKWEFPHPLLIDGRDDYVAGSFILREKEELREVTHNEFIFHFEYNLDCPGLELYIIQGNASVMLRVTSSAASFRKKFKFESGTTELKIRLAQNELVKNVHFTAFIVSIGDKKFSLSEHNEEYYSNLQFELRKGDILAESETIRISLDDSELQKPLTSIFQITESENAQEAMRPSFENSDGKIHIYLSPELYQRYDELKWSQPSLRRNLSAVITMPVLVEAIEKMQSEGDDRYEDYRWHKALSNRLAHYDIDIEEPTLSSATIANKIYGNIIFDAMSSIRQRLDDVINRETPDFGGDD